MFDLLNCCLVSVFWHNSKAILLNQTSILIIHWTQSWYLVNQSSCGFQKNKFWRFIESQQCLTHILFWRINYQLSFCSWMKHEKPILQMFWDIHINSICIESIHCGYCIEIIYDMEKVSGCPILELLLSLWHPNWMTLCHSVVTVSTNAFPHLLIL